MGELSFVVDGHRITMEALRLSTFFHRLTEEVFTKDTKARYYCNEIIVKIAFEYEVSIRYSPKAYVDMKVLYGDRKEVLMLKEFGYPDGYQVFSCQKDAIVEVSRLIMLGRCGLLQSIHNWHKFPKF